ncbi:hypothetical protein ACJIZ3_016776 [Penstemon smallii]|uniref:Bifunctional inhibitor/plant lipid transfer protein/seed storage helical domain-containing protein n=1 Tax=Penstemon smallii TaxID=265156 RepID=A0ABD3STM8_9LAMI
MATKNYETGFVLIILITLTLLTRARAQSSCSSTVMSLSSCLNYITGNSTTPSQPCCTSLSNVVETQPQCLCPLLNNNGVGSSTLGIAINQTLAMALPALCNVQTPRTLSQCNDANGPASAPAPWFMNSPTDGSSEPNDQEIPSGSKTVPGTSGSTTETSSILFTFVTLLIVAWIAQDIQLLSLD